MSLQQQMRSLQLYRQVTGTPKDSFMCKDPYYPFPGMGAKIGEKKKRLSAS